MSQQLSETCQKLRFVKLPLQLSETLSPYRRERGFSDNTLQTPTPNIGRILTSGLWGREDNEPRRFLYPSQIQKRELHPLKKPHGDDKKHIELSYYEKHRTNPAWDHHAERHSQPGKPSPTEFGVSVLRAAPMHLFAFPGQKPSP